ncbi:NAD-P-binding protein [Amylostereum chailletii]|nr:NAD-P-binding protein [Amylostereum chailletii]
MSGYTTFAIAGLGHIGPYIAAEFLKAKANGTVKEVIILTRADSSNPEVEKFATQGAKVISVDYNDQASLTKALAGVDVLVSTIAGPALPIQVPLAEAAKAAGVQLFVPSEFGNPTEGIKEGIFTHKSNMHAKLREIGIPYTLVFNGPFSDYVFIEPVGLDVKSGKVRIGGDGNVPISFTARPDIARYLVYALTKFSPGDLKNKVLRIEGDRKTFNELFKQYEAKTGKKLNVEFTPVSELEAAVKANMFDMNAVLHLGWAQGGGNVGSSTDNAKYPGWNPKPVVECLL